MRHTDLILPRSYRQGTLRRGRSRPIASSLLLGLAAWIAFPTVIAQQDVASLIAGGFRSPTRWTGFVETAGAGSVQDFNMPFVDSETTGSIAGGGVEVPGVGRVAFSGKFGAAPGSPDEDRVTRGEKRGRVVSIVPIAPPKRFNAGSLVKRSSMLRKPERIDPLTMAFLTPRIQGEEIQIATAFHMREQDERLPGISGAIAELITNTEPDILATAYAPPKADYARASPFASILKEERKTQGRFIPPLGKDDHEWLRRPLPPSVFSESEQRCLTAGIYFEARGEPVVGQAAVAQVILNRVRNPAYPATICGVVYQNDSWRNRCQFSFACDGIRDRVASRRHWDIADEVARAATAGLIWLPGVGSATHYHADYVKPRWAKTMKRVKTIGKHIFYRTHGGGWS